MMNLDIYYFKYQGYAIFIIVYASYNIYPVVKLFIRIFIFGSQTTTFKMFVDIQDLSFIHQSNKDLSFIHQPNIKI